MIKLIATDMDGTLLDDNKKFSDEFFEIHEKLTEKGIHFLVASGRQYYNILEYFKDLKSNLIIMAENGSIVMENGEELFSRCLTKKDAIKLVKEGRAISSANVILCGKKSAYVESKNIDFLIEVEKYYKKYEIVRDLTEIDDEILKVTVCDLTGAEKNTYPHYQKFERDYQVAVSGEIWVDIVDKKINKGIALKRLREKLGIHSSEVMVFGDYLNDYEMMKEGEYSFAMKNAHPKLKEVAKYEAKSNNESGVLESIKSYVL